MLEGRKSLKDDDVYYLGMLQHLAGNGDGALKAMQRYLEGEASGANAQVARAVVVLYSTRQNLIPDSDARSRLMRKTSLRIWQNGLAWRH